MKFYPTNLALALAAALLPLATHAESIDTDEALQVPALVITSGRNRVDDKKVAQRIGQNIGKADADFVRTHTGFVIGGVAPIAHAAPPIALMDADLLHYAVIWPAAGHPNTMFRISPKDLARIAGAEIADIAQ